MEEVMQNAIETIDNARQHKCELEGRLAQLNACFSQVSITSERSRKNIRNHFSDLQTKILKQIKLKTEELIEQVDVIEKEALEPLKECKVILEDGITESRSVIENGETLLQHEDDMNSENNVKKLNKFTNMANSLSLDSVPEVPSITEVACVSFHFDEKELDKETCDAINGHGKISKQAPVQITELEPRPGGMVVTWDEMDADSSVEWLDNGNTVLYKLQYCQGKVTYTSHSRNGTDSGYPEYYFRDAYIGKHFKHTVKKLLPNTVYTFRVSRSLIEGDDISKAEHWSPWSVYQDGITTLPGYEWADPSESEAYVLQDKKRVALKKSNSSQILYSKEGGYIIGYPITFKVEVEGKSHSLGDGFALVVKADQTCHSIVKEGSLCLSSDGRIFINGTESKTRFSNFCRNMSVRFIAREIQVDNGEDNRSKGKKGKGKHVVTLRVSITVMDKEAVFDWRISSSTQLALNSQGKLCLNFAAAFKSSSWKFSVI